MSEHTQALRPEATPTNERETAETITDVAAVGDTVVSIVEAKLAIDETETPLAAIEAEPIGSLDLEHFEPVSSELEAEALEIQRLEDFPFDPRAELAAVQSQDVVLIWPRKQRITTTAPDEHRPYGRNGELVSELEQRILEAAA